MPGSDREIETRGHRRKSKHAAKLGAIFILLALIGVIAIVWLIVSLSGKLMDDSKQKQEFESILRPVVMFDPVPFDGIDKADEKMLLQSSMWATLFNEDRTKYSYDDGGMMIIPKSDVEKNGKLLFGDGLKLNHQSFGDYEFAYIYNEETDSYHVPTSGYTGLYTPQVDTFRRVGDTYYLKVGYIPPGFVWEGDAVGNKYSPSPVKFMEYVMKKADNRYILTAINDIKMDSSISRGSSSANHESTDGLVSTPPVSMAPESGAGVSGSENSSGVSDEAPVNSADMPIDDTQGAASEAVDPAA